MRRKRKQSSLVECRVLKKLVLVLQFLHSTGACCPNRLIHMPRHREQLNQLPVCSHPSTHHDTRCLKRGKGTSERGDEGRREGKEKGREGLLVSVKRLRTRDWEGTYHREYSSLKRKRRDKLRQSSFSSKDRSSALVR